MGLGEGVTKGFGTFIKTVISCSLYFRQLSGILLSSCEELQGTKNIENLSEREPSNIISSLCYGIKNGIIDIVKEVTGTFIKPYHEGKKSDIGDFFKELYRNKRYLPFPQ